MECDICCRTGNDNHSLLCPTCARSSIYNLRIDLATSLLDREEAAKRVKAVDSGDVTKVPATLTLDGAIVDLRDCHTARKVEGINSETRLVSDRLEVITEKVSKLQEEIAVSRALLAERKAVQARMKSDAESARYGLSSRSTADIEAIQKNIRQTRRKWDMDHTHMVQGRISLCRNAAKLARLRKQKVVEGQSIREHFEIARGLRIFDLREMNAADPETLTASLTQVAFLICRVSIYLALRPPSEIVTPHRDHPHATMFSPSSSYTNRDISKPKNQSSANSPSASRLLSQRVATPRALHITKSLPKLYKEDPHAFSLFVEGVVLLAWDIAWLCKSQGMAGFSSWSDICDIGRNLWQLLMADNRAVQKTAAEREKLALGLAKDSTTATAQNSNVPAHFGYFSHGSANLFFGREGAEMQRAWKLQSPTKAIDKIKAHLIQEMQGAEWEVLEEGEWAHTKELLKAAEEPVLIGGRRWSATKKDAVPNKGTSGWTRLRLRSDAQQNDLPDGMKGSIADEAIQE